MGQESSILIDERTPPQTLSERSVKAVAKLIRQSKAKNIVVLTGAGISTSAGIPDFRSPDTGLYANLARLNLPYPEAVFDISYFRNNPLPFYTLAHELAPGKFKPTVAHCLIRLLADKGLLLKLFTQNIDCLERKAGVPESLIVEAHGSFATQSCIQCRARFPEELMKQAIEDTEIPHCLGPQCGGLVKPDIVFFGEQLPETFHANRILCSRADLCIIMGTSLSVQPFASLPGMCPEGVPRVLINSERVGGLGSRADDVLVLGSCDDGAWQLADALGWEDELQTLYQTMSDLEKEEPRAQKTEDEALQDEIAKITAEVDRSLRIGDAQKQWLEKHLEEKHLSNTPGAPELSLNSLRDGQLAEKSPREGGSQATVTKKEGYGDGIQSVKATELGNEDSPIRVKKEQIGAAEDDWEDVRDSSEAEVD